MTASWTGRKIRNSFSTTMTQATNAPNLSSRVDACSNGPGVLRDDPEARHRTCRASSSRRIDASTVAPAYSASPT